MFGVKKFFPIMFVAAWTGCTNVDTDDDVSAAAEPLISTTAADSLINYGRTKIGTTENASNGSQPRRMADTTR